MLDGTVGAIRPELRSGEREVIEAHRAAALDRDAPERFMRATVYNTTRILNPAMVLKEFVGVSDRLAEGRLTSEQRLALLRRQAELGDLRDALADRARRQAAV